MNDSPELSSDLKKAKTEECSSTSHSTGRTTNPHGSQQRMSEIDQQMMAKRKLAVSRS
jgi:hypothetical protein